MAAESICAECGAPLPENAPGNRCPKCLLQLGLDETGNEDAPEKAPGPGEEAAEPPAETRATMPDSDSVEEQIGTMIGRYRLLQQIGEGGFGVVFMAEQTEPVQRKVALKVIKAGMDTREIVARFEAERQALALMDHPNIARVLDAGTTASRRPYFVMELVRGIPITEYCDQANLSTRERLELFIKVCRAVQHAHQKGVIHRDLKPTNVLVTLHDGEAVPKVIDFGVAKALGQKLTEKTLFTRFEQIIGTPAYMSPEQAALGGLDIDTRTDIYSLGVLLYELLTGVTPLDAATLRKGALDEIRRMIRETDPPKPSTRLQTMGGRLAEIARCRHAEPATLSRLIRGDLDWITMKCLEKDRQRRYETVNGLARDIERHLTNNPVVARPPSRVYRVQKWVRRNKLVFSAVALIFLVLVLGIVVSTWQAVRATRAEREQGLLKLNAVAEKNKAQTEAAKQEAINRFLNDMLASANPDKVSAADASKGRNVTVVQALAGAAKQLDGNSLKDQPAVEAAVRETIGITYLGLGQAEAAEPQLLKSLALNRRLYGEHSEQTAWSLLVVSGVFGEHSKGKEAEKLSKEALGIEIELPGRQHPHVARALLELGGHYCAQCKGRGTPEPELVDRAETTLREALAIQRKLPKPNQRTLADTLSTLAEVLMYFRRGLVEAESLLRESLSIQKAIYGSKNPGIAGSLERLAWLLAQKQDLAEAEKCGREAVAIQREVLGPKHSGLSSSLAALGDVLIHEQRLSEAEATFRECLAIRREVAPQSLDVAWTIRMLAQILTAEKKFSEAEPLYREELEGFATSVGKEIYWLELQALLAVLKSENKPDQIEALYREVLDRARNSLGETNVVVPALLCQLGDFMVSSGRTNEAQQLYQQVVEIIPKLYPTHLLVAIRSLAESLRSQGKAGEAETLYSTLIQVESQNSKEPDFFLADLRHELGNLLLSHNQLAAAAEQFAKALPARRLHRDDNLVWTLRGLGNGLMYTSRPKEAEPYLREALSIYWNLHQQDDFYGTACIKKDVAYVLVAEGRLPEAEQAYREAMTSFNHCKLIDDREFVEAVESFAGLLDATGEHVQAEAFLNEVVDQVRKQLAAEQGTDKTLQRLQRLQDPGARAALGREWSDRLRQFQREAQRELLAQDPGAIKQWLVLAPIALSDHNGAKALDRQQVPDESQLRSQADQRIKVGETELTWKPLQGDDYLVDFNQFLGKPTEWSVAYSVCYLRSDFAQTNLLMKVGSDDEAKVYLNGRQIYQHSEGRSYVPDQDEVRGVELNAGLNVLIFKVVNERFDWRGSVRFVDAAGQPIKGLRVTLRPP